MFSKEVWHLKSQIKQYMWSCSSLDDVCFSGDFLGILLILLTETLFRHSLLSSSTYPLTHFITQTSKKENGVKKKGGGVCLARDAF